MALYRTGAQRHALEQRPPSNLQDNLAPNVARLAHSMGFGRLVERKPHTHNRLQLSLIGQTAEVCEVLPIRSDHEHPRLLGGAEHFGDPLERAPEEEVRAGQRRDVDSARSKDLAAGGE